MYFAPLKSYLSLNVSSPLTFLFKALTLRLNNFMINPQWSKVFYLNVCSLSTHHVLWQVQSKCAVGKTYP